MKKVLIFAGLILLLCAALSLPAFAAGSGTIALSDQTVMPGQEFTMSLNLTQNPGLASMRLHIAYPADLQLVSVTDTGLLTGFVAPNPTISSPYTLFWKDSYATTNNVKTGTIATLKFRALASASYGNKAVTVTVLESRTYDLASNSFAAVSANVFVRCAGHSFGAYKVTKQASCLAAGEEVRTCSICGTQESRALPALGHAWGAYTVTTKAGCKVTGEETRTCTLCGATNSRTLPATGHSFGAWQVTKEPTCEETGMRAHTCEKCGTRIVDVMGALGHDFEKTSKTIRQPSLFLPGLVEGVCTRCQKKTEIETVCRATDMVSGIILEVEKGCFVEGARMKVEEIGAKSDNYDTLKEIADELDGAYALYHLDVLANGESVPANGVIKATFPTPEGFSRSMKIYFISPDGDPVELPATVNVDGNLVSTTITQFGYFAIVDPAKENPDAWDDGEYDEPEDTDTAAELPEEENSGLTWLWITLGVIFAAALIGGGIVWIVLKKKKASAPGDTE